MTRREFALGFSAGMLASGSSPRPQIAITMDDFNWRAIPGEGSEKTNRALLDALAKHSNLKIDLFVAGGNVDNPRGRELLQTWNDAGHSICNHTYSHRSYNNTASGDFSGDLLRCEDLIGGYSSFRRMFRFPALKEGNTAAKRDYMRRFLASHGYRNGHVTIDNSDWYYDQRLRSRLKDNPATDPQAYRDVYLDHLWTCATYYDGLARKVAGVVPHTLLLHYTLLNGLFLDDVLTMFESKGWQLISAPEAYHHPVFSNNPRTLPAGESLIWAMAKASPKHASLLRYPGEGMEYEKAKLDRLGL